LQVKVQTTIFVHIHCTVTVLHFSTNSKKQGQSLQNNQNTPLPANKAPSCQNGAKKCVLNSNQLQHECKASSLQPSGFQFEDIITRQEWNLMLTKWLQNVPFKKFAPVSCHDDLIYLVLDL
jgi:hypothetical protein